MLFCEVKLYDPTIDFFLSTWSQSRLDPRYEMIPQTNWSQRRLDPRDQLIPETTWTQTCLDPREDLISDTTWSQRRLEPRNYSITEMTWSRDDFIPRWLYLETTLPRDDLTTLKQFTFHQKNLENISKTMGLIKKVIGF